jgi:hypothetical protein
MPRKFFKTVYQIEVLSEDNPLPDELTLAQIEYEITEGHCSGSISIIETWPLTAKEAAEALMAQGSDPEFFRLDEDGKDLDDFSDEEPPMMDT